ncbi:glycosyl transferases group 1 family protein [Microcystis aeruginosa TAIHU98]|uniref:Glycosyl transferases group 1 family protein n=1 Tax=Microcystis aeruginosa TAIHU98 TaxID=1134457 RepID=L7E4W9_MICAE|nr:glycosyl transferases group 1 family protein [Microcystis aeruginosa TAIHU98]
MQNWIDRAVKSQKFSVITSEHSVNEIYIRPQGQITYPDTTLTLVGGNPSLEVQELTKLKGVIVTRQVPLMTTYLYQATVVVIPLRTGFGMNFKTLEFMASGVPVVASDRGLERLTVAVNNVPLAALMANSIEQYCTAISSLFKSAELREKLSRNARKLIEYNYTWQQAAGKYEQVLTADIC